MDRYVAMLWDTDAPPQSRQVERWTAELQRASDRWRVVLDAPGLRVVSLVHRGDAPIVTHMTEADGVVIGVLFERGAERSGRVRELGADATKRVIASEGDKLVKNYWGNYVAIWRNAASRSVTILRDPCGAVPCFITRQCGLDLVCAHAEDIAALSQTSFSIDWTYLRAFLNYKYFVTEHTGLSNVTELLPGARRTSGEASWVWNAARIAAEPSPASFADACSELRAVTEACFAAWTSEYSNIIVSLSGGLDSSTMAALLQRSGASRLTALHFRGAGYEDYETKLAREAATHASIPLVEVSQDPKTDDVRRILNAGRSARPKEPVLGVQIDDFFVELADRTGADCFMVGQGGDNLFLQRGAASHTFTDFLHEHAFGPKALSIAYDASSLLRTSIWTVFRRALQDRRNAASWNPFAFLDTTGWAAQAPTTPDALRSIPDAYKLHPWYEDAARLASGKRLHLTTIIALYHYYIDHWRGLTRDVVYPLFSQPIAEVALRTPTYVLSHGGTDRALERCAFADITPPTIRRRTGKTGANLYISQVLHANLDFYRDLLLTGELIRADWIDRNKVERMLSSEYVAHGGGKKFIHLLVVAEAWLRAWTKPRIAEAA